MQVLIFLLVVCLALGCFAWANDSLAAYEHNRWLVESERTNQVQVHEHGLTQREALNDAMVSNALHRPMPQLPVQNDGIPIVVIPGPTPTATSLPPGMVVISVSSATATAMAVSN